MEPKREDIDSSISKDNLLYSKYVWQGVDVSEGNVTQKVFNKKGQVTIFIIVGIIILVAAAAVFFVTRSTVTERLTAEGEPVIEVPTEFFSIKQFTENCLIDVGKQGLLLLGEQGGYIYPDLVGEYSVVNPTDSDGLNLEPLKIPYWHYNKEPNNGNKIVFSSLQPKLYASEDKEMSVEAQLGRFVNEKLEGCLQGYQAIEKQGYDVEVLSLPDAEVHVTDDYVQFWLKFDVEASRGESQHSFDTFFMKVPLQLKKYYDVAAQITSAERDYSVAERQALDLLSVYGAVDAGKLPPLEEVRFDAIPAALWSAAEVREKVKTLLMARVPLLRYLGGSNFYRHEYALTPGTTVDLRDLHQKNYDNTILPLTGGENLEVNFDYFGWEPYFDVNDRGGTIEPSTVTVNYKILNFNTQHYYTSYDLSYPFLVTIRDPRAFDGEGFTFIFSLEANIRNNEVVQSEEVLPPPLAAVSKSMVCEPGKRNTELIKTLVVDSATKEPLDAVQIGFSVPEQDNCIMGITANGGELETKYPAVYGGVASFMKEEYLTNFYPIDTYRFKKQPGIIGYAVAEYAQPVVELHKRKTIPITVKKKSLEKCIKGSLGEKCFAQDMFSSAGNPLYSYQPQMLDSTHSWIFGNVAKKLKESESATVVLNRVADVHPLVFSDDFTATATVRGEGTAEIELVPGVYEVTALLTSEVPLTIPEEERCSGGILEAVGCQDLSGCCSTFEETTLNKMLLGQLSWNQPETYFTITSEQLYGSEKITFYILEFNEAGVPEKEHQRVLEDLQVAGQLNALSARPEIRPALEPRFS